MSDARAILPGYLPQDKSQYLQSLEDTDNMFASLPPKPLLGDTSLAASGRSKAAASRLNTFASQSGQSSAQFGQNQKRSGHSVSSGFDEDLQSMNSTSLQGESILFIYLLMCFAHSIETNKK